MDGIKTFLGNYLRADFKPDIEILLLREVFLFEAFFFFFLERKNFKKKVIYKIKFCHIFSKDLRA